MKSNVFYTAARKSRSALLLILFLFACVLFSAESQNAVRKPFRPKKPSSNMGSIATLMIRLAANQHYSGKRYDSELSCMIFDDYLKHLDPLHMFFLQSDVDALARERQFLSAQLLKGQVDFAFKAFNLMVSRMIQYESFARGFLSVKQDLSTHEAFDLEHDKAPYPADMKEMKDFWRKKILNDLIVLRLADRAEAKAEAEKAAKEKASGDAEKKPDEKKTVADDAEAKPKKTPEERIIQRISRTVRYFQDMEAMDVLEQYLTSAVQVLDPHSAYMSPRTNEDFDIDMSLSLVGIGAALSSEDGYTKIVEIIPGGPADLSGELKPGDRIIAVRQEEGEKVDVIDMPLSKVVSMIRGKEATKVHLTVLKAGHGLSAPVQITITRAKVELKNSAAQGKVMNRNGKRIGVIRLPSFYMDFNAAKLGKDYRSATNDVKKILQGFQPEKVDGVIIDLRSNGGGSLREALKLTGLFIKSGPVVQVRGRHETEVEEDDDEGLLVYDGPLAVLINQFSASSSEIFAAAIRDYERGVLTGDAKTHGKGTVQFVNDLDRYMPYFTGKRFPAGSIRLTNAKFYRINGESTQLKGVEADVPFPSFSDLMDVGEDKLDHALPWDTIPATRFRCFRAPWAVTPEIRQELKRRSLERMANDPDFKLLNSWIEEFRKIKDRKSVPLDMEARWEEYQRQEALRKEQEALYEPKSRRARRTDAGKKTDAAKSKDKGEEDEKDIYLSETINVLCDLIEIAGKKEQN